MARLIATLSSPKRLIAAVLALFVVFWLGAGLYVQHVRQLQAERHARTEALAEELIAKTRNEFKEISLIRQGELDALRTYRNAAHVERGRALGITVLQDRDAAEILTQTDSLVEIQTNQYYRVREMTHSIPHVTRSTAHLLTLIGMRFQAALREEGLPPYRYVVTSATRTMDDQRRLRGSNVNAALTSSHFFGTTLDLHYREFEYVPTEIPLSDSVDVFEDVLESRLEEAYTEMAHTRQQKLKAVLGRVLLELQEEGKVLVIYERLQPVYHITLGKRLMAPPKQPSLQAANRPVASTPAQPVRPGDAIRP